LKELPSKDRLVVITIPDFGATPVGPKYAGGRNITKGLSEFNRIIIGEAKKRELALVDIFRVSQAMKTDPSLVAADGLHPSPKEYAVWEEMIYPIVEGILKD